MLKFLRAWFAAPVFVDDADQTRAARLLTTLLLVTLGGAGLYTLIVIGFAPDQLPRLLFLLPALVLVGGVRALMVRQRVRLAGLIFCGCLWGLMTLAALQQGGLRSSVFGEYMTVVIVSGLTVGRRAAVGFVGLSLLATLGMAYAESQQWLSELPTTYTVFSLWTGQAVYLVVVALVLSVALGTIDDAFAQARRELAERRQAEAALHASEARYRLLTSVSSDYTFFSQANPNGSYTLQWVAGAFETVTGFTLEEYVARGGWSAALHPDDRAQDDQSMDELRANRRVVTEIRTLHKDGTVRWERVYAQPVWDAAQQTLTGIYGAVQDVTERKQAEIALRHYIERMEILHELDRAIMAARSPTEIGLAALSRIQRLVASQRAEVTLIDEATHEVVLLAVNAQQESIWPTGTRGPVETFQSQLEVLKRGKPFSYELASIPKVLRAEGLRSGLSMPLLWRDELLGALNVWSDQPTIPPTWPQEVVRDVAHQLALAIHHVRLLAETTEALAREQRLTEIAHALNSQLDLPTTLITIVRLAVESVGAEAGAMGLVTPDGEALVHPHLVNLPDGLGLAEPIPKGQGLGWHIIETGQAICLNDYADFPGALPQWVASGIHGLVEVPLVAGELRLGVLGLYLLDRTRRYTDRDRALAESIGRQAGLAIQNARLFESEQRRVALLRALHEIGLDLSAQLDLPTLLRTIMERAARLLDASMGGFYLLQPDGKTLVPVANLPAEDVGSPVQVGQGLVGRVAEASAPMLIDDYRQWPGRLSSNTNFCAVASVPIQWQGRVLGVISVCDPRPGRFGPEHIEIVRLLAAQAAVAIENAQLYTDLERRVAERTLELEAANQELESFSFSISHDLRAPLRGIESFSRMLQEEHSFQLSVDAQYYLNRVRANTRRMSELIDDLLTFARLGRQPMTKHWLDPQPLVQQVLDELRAAYPAQPVEIRVGDLPQCEADPSLLRQVFFNLLDNALKYSSKRAAPQLEVGSQLQAGQAVYYVRDNGAGFDMRYVDKLFGVFQRLHRAEEFDGTGVGLATVHRIIIRHGGRVWAESQVDVGSTFYFTLSAH